MHARRLKRLPVVDAEGRLVGVLGRLDILRSIASGYAQRTVPHAGTLPQEHRTVGQLMERDVPTVPETAPLADVVGKLLASEVKRVVVVNGDGQPVGMITDTDLVARVDPEQRPGLLTQLRSRWNEAAHRHVQRASGQRAADVMTTPVTTVHGHRLGHRRAHAGSGAAREACYRSSMRRAALVGIVSRPALLAASLDLATEGQ